jgi:phosphoenolpyruvate synthase/pyruvate phosphate dikinase
LNVRGAAAVTQAVQKAFASLFTARAISYRLDMGFEHMKVALSVGVQKMVRSDLASAGVIFTLDPDTGHRIPDIAASSVTPDALARTTRRVLEAEQQKSTDQVAEKRAGSWLASWLRRGHAKGRRSRPGAR